MPVRFRPRAVLGCGDNTDEEKTDKSRVRLGAYGDGHQNPPFIAALAQLGRR